MFSPVHGGMLVVIAGLIFAVVRVGQSAARRDRSERITRALAFFGLGFWIFQQGYALLWTWEPSSSLPLHVCDLTALLGPIALLTRKRLLRTTVYFWALGLSVWGLITPTLNEGPGQLDFWLFWISHGLVMLYAIYDCAVRGYRPSVGDFGLAYLVTLSYVAVVLPLNVANPGWNYGYLADVGVSVRTPLDFLPRWPWRVLAMEGLGALMLANAWLPWAVAGWRQKRQFSQPRENRDQV